MEKRRIRNPADPMLNFRRISLRSRNNKISRKSEKLFLFFPYVARLSLFYFVQFSLYLQIARQLDNFKRQYRNETRQSPISIGVLRFFFPTCRFYGASSG